MRRKGERVSDEADARRAEEERAAQAEEARAARLRTHVAETRRQRLHRTARRWDAFLRFRYYLSRTFLVCWVASLIGWMAYPSPYYWESPWLMIPWALCGLVLASLVVYRVWGPRLKRQFEVAARELPPPPAEEAARAEPPRAEDAIASLDDQWSWVQERVGDEQWQRLLGLRNTWLLLSRLGTYARVACYAAAGLAVVGLYGALSRGKQITLADALGQPIFVLPVVALIGAWAGRGLVRQTVARELGRLVLEGRSPEAVQRALWANWQADTLRAWQRREQTRAARPPRPPRPRWRMELSGMHLVLWLMILTVLIGDNAAHGSKWVTAVAILTFVGWTLKACLWLLIAFTGSASSATAAYRWFGTWYGGLVGLLALPFASAALGWGMRWLVGLFGR